MAGKFWDKGPMVVTGCTKVSEGCRGCWSEQAHVMRSKGPNAHVWPSDCLTDSRFNGKVHFNLDALKNAVKGKKPQVIAVWNDLYHEGVTDEQLINAFGVMLDNPQHTYLIITKRIERAARFMPDFHILAACVNATFNDYKNIIHIATMEDQKYVDKRMRDLLQIPGKRGIIIEPMLGPVDFNFMTGTSENIPIHETLLIRDAIHQVILGGETGKDARPMHPDWVRSVRDQCAAAGVPFFFKSWGDIMPIRKRPLGAVYVDALEEGYDFKRVGQKKAGRLLDGREHNDLAWRT